MTKKKQYVIDDDGYYDPQLAEVIAGAPVAVRTVRKGYSRALGMARKIPFFKKYEVYFKLLVVLAVWAIGIYLIYLWTKSAIVKALGATMTGLGYSLIFPTTIGLTIVNSIGVLFGAPNIFDPKATTQPTDAQKTAIQDIIDTITNPYCIIWSIICLLIALYIYGSTPKAGERAMRIVGYEATGEPIYGM